MQLTDRVCWPPPPHETGQGLQLPKPQSYVVQGGFEHTVLASGTGPREAHVEMALATTPSAAHETERCLSPYPQVTEHAPHSDDLYSSCWHVPRPHRMSSGGGGSWLQFEAGASAPVPCTWHLSTRDWEPMPHVTEQAPHGVLAFHSYETGARVAMGDGVEPEPANVLSSSQQSRSRWNEEAGRG